MYNDLALEQASVINTINKQIELQDTNMLFSKSITAGEVVTVKLVSGEELIGKLKSESDTHYSVERPLVLAMSQQGLVFQPWLFTVDGEVLNLPKDKVIVVAITNSTSAKSYLSSTSGIELQ